MTNTVEFNGKTFDVPSWIPVEEFLEGLESEDPNEPLSSLISSKLHKKNPSTTAISQYWSASTADVFALEFLVPFRELRELSLQRFRAIDFKESVIVSDDHEFWGADEIETEVKSDGIHVKFFADGCFDANDIQIFAAPSRDFTKTLEALDTLDFLDEVREEIVAEFEYVEDEIGSPELDLFTLFTRDAVEWTLYKNVHED